MMTVFFYSGITSYPGVSTEEKTIISNDFFSEFLRVKCVGMQKILSL